MTERKSSSRAMLRPALILGSLLILSFSLSHSFVVSGPTWSPNIVSYRINPNLPTNFAGSSDQQIETLRCAADVWRDQAQTNFTFNYVGVSSGTVVNTGDGSNIVFYTNTPASGGTLAAVFTSSFFGDFTGFDMVFFPSNDGGTITWNGVGDPFVNQVDVSAVGVHEFGHALGLDHTSVTAATMEAFYDGVFERTLDADDIAGSQFLYGTNPSLNPDPVINDVIPATGDPAGGYEVVLLGENFTWEANTTLRINGVVLSSAFYEVENPCRIRIDNMPAGSGSVPIRVTNELGDFTLDNAFVYEQPLSGVIRAGIGQGSPGSTAEVLVDADFDFDIAGFSVAASFDPSEVQVVDVTVDGTDAAGAEFVAPNFDNVTGNWTLGVALDISPPFGLVILAGTGRELCRVTYEILPSAPIGSFSLITLADGLGNPAVDNVLTNVFGVALSPSLTAGAIEISPAGLFIRGDANGDSSINIGDAITILNGLFLAGPVLCADAHDTNDDGSLNIADAVYLLNWLFTNGPEPPAPFPNSGSDPTGDGLGCDA